MFGTELALILIQHVMNIFTTMYLVWKLFICVRRPIAAWWRLVLLNRVFVHSFCFTVPRLYVGEFFCPIVSFD